MSVALRPRSLGEVLDGAFRLLREDFGLYALTAIICFAPFTLVNALLFTPPESLLLILVAVLLLFPALLGMLVCWPALTHDMDTRLQGGEPGLKSGLQRGLRLAGRVFGIGFLANIAIFVLFFAVVLFDAFVVGILSALSPVVGLIVGIPLVIGTVVGAALILVPRLFLVLPVAVIEDAPILLSFSRGSELAKGAALTITALFFVAWILFTLPSIAVLAITGTMGSAFSPESATMTLPLGTLVIQQGLSLLLTAVTAPFMAAVMVLTYYDRRIRSEGYDLESAADDLLV